MATLIQRFSSRRQKLGQSFLSWMRPTMPAAKILAMDVMLKSLLAFLYEISTRTKSMLLATATPVQLRPVEA